jgi:uncharacterized protein (DUF58 family)
MKQYKGKQNYLDPEVVRMISNMELRARLVVEGFISGLHKSPYQGFSVEFAEHREYVPGDELKHIDWRVFGKSDRFYIKLYEEDTNLKCYILLDVSESMRYSSNGITKFEYGANLAGALTYLMLRQLDSVGLLTFDDAIRKYIPPRASPRHLKIILNELDMTRTGNPTRVSSIFHDFAERIRKRGLIIVISDLLDDPDEILTSLQHFRHKKHEVIVFHLLDDDELTFPFDRLTLFKGLEDSMEILTEPHSLRRSYLAHLEEFLQRLKRGCSDGNIDYNLVNTKESYARALTQFLAARQRVS